MELSERFIRELEREYPTVYEWQDDAGKQYEPTSHVYPLSLYVTDGELTVHIGDEAHTVIQNKRFDIPAGTTYSLTAGPDGAIYIVGEDA